MRQKQKNFFISRFIRDRYFKIKFKLVLAKNSINPATSKGAGIIKKIYIFFYKIYLKLLAQIILLCGGQKESFDILKEDLQNKHNKKINMIINGQKVNLEEITEKLKNNQIENKDQVIQELIEKLFELHKQKQKKAIVFSLAGLSVVTIASIAISLIVTIIMPSVRQSKAAADGVIDPTYKYAWNENTGWINFGTENGNVHVADSGLSGYALSETVGWIYLDNVINDGEGNLSGYGWGENVGWINFAPANGGVVINSSGEFTGSALSETMGWIIFGGDYKVQTDWRPQSVRPDCNNALDDDSDGLIDYPSDLGCESLTDDNEINPGGLPPSVLNPPTPPAETPTKENPKGGFNILINNGDEYANNKNVELKLFGGSDTKKMSISNFADFKDAVQIPFQTEIQWELKFPQPPLAKGGNIETVFAKFYTQYGQPSDAVSDTIILDEIPPEKPTIIYPNNNSIIKIDKPLFKGEAEKESIITLKLASGSMELINVNITTDQNGKWSYSPSFSLAYGDYQLKIYTQDLAKNKSEEVVSNFRIQPFVFPTQPTKPVEPITPVELPETLKQENIKTQEQENNEPAEPVKPTKQENTTPTEPIKPVEPIKPTEPVEPVEPTEPVKPVKSTETLKQENNEPAEPVKPTEPTETLKQETVKTSFRQEVKKFGNKASSLMHSGLQSASSLINNISNQTKRGIDSVANQIEGAGQTIVGALGKLTSQKEKMPPQEKVIATTTQKPIPTPEPQNLLLEKVVVKTAFGNVSLTPDLTSEEREKSPEIFGLSKQEINVFVKPAKPAFGVLGQILYSKTTAQLKQKKIPPFARGGWGNFPMEWFSPLAILKPALAMAQSETDPKPQTLGGWKMSEFSFSDEDNNGIYKAKVKLPAGANDYVVRTIIAYKDGTIKSLDASVKVAAQGYVYRKTMEGEIRIDNVKVALLEFDQNQKKYRLWNGSSYNKENPQITKGDGAYSFFAPKGRYYLAAQVEGCKDYKTKEFEVVEDGSPINFNIEMEKKFDWIKAISFALIILAAVGIVSILSIFFYERKAKRRD